MAYVVITGKTETTKTAKNGKVFDGVEITGISPASKFGPEKPYSKFLYGFQDNELAMFAPFEVGDKVNIRNVQNDKGFWDISEVLLLEKGAGNQGDGGSPTDKVPSQQSRPTAPAAPFVPQAKGSGSVQFGRDPAEIIRTDALTAAVGYMGNILAAPDKFKKLLKATATLDVLSDMTIDLAKQMEGFIVGKEVQAGIKSNDADLDKQSAPLPDTGLPAMPTDDEGDEIPF